jgi:hypothetical protein
MRSESDLIQTDRIENAMFPLRGAPKQRRRAGYLSPPKALCYNEHTS